VAYWDFDLYQNAGGTTPLVWQGGPSGLAEVNSLLTNPLTTENYYCRQFFASPVNNNRSGNTQHLLKATAADNQFDAIPSTKSVSLRAWVRYSTGTTDTWSASNIGLCAKSSIISSTQGEAFAAYKLRLGGVGSTTTGTTRSSQVNLRLSVTNSSGFLSDAANEIICTGIYDRNVWYKIRLDIIPISGDTADRLVAYTGVGPTGSEVWTQVGQLDILDTDTTYRAWGNSLFRYGYYAAHNFSANSSATNINVYIDRFQAFILDN